MAKTTKPVPPNAPSKKHGKTSGSGRGNNPLGPKSMPKPKGK